MSATKTFRCYLVEKDADGNVTGAIGERPLDALPEGEVIVRVAYSSLNYKDALSATGHPGVNRVFPHIPGVDAAGIVFETGVYEWVEGDPVLVTGFDMGSNRWGGYGEYIRVPQDWIVPLPYGLTLRESMMLGTAGLTAGLCVDALEKHDIQPNRGEVVVTGASGGVGSLAVSLLSKLGYQVAAVTGKRSAYDYLRNLGAHEILPREAVCDTTEKPLLHGRWSAAIDTVGGTTLSTLLRTVRHGGCIASCGNASGHELITTVYPFILRGLTLVGIDAAYCPLSLRHAIWERLAVDWKLDCLEEISQFVDLAALPPHFDKILSGQLTGRTVVTITSEEEITELPEIEGTWSREESASKLKP